ncbi:hypothetical protein BCR33DRAFT_844990 [Rhizoclosmatium globosum]|uniref:Uncharacterized protein n=1 Tax=Rhizoclosmatium globosum TaxID=329046 RepID=A0A1Y2D377_9FUNG|nr:hypothetical protein BCR33DRAFT_844990 [Rhizoclosmatium globosum]|eukprot:ORY53732.1 hypothetical protein BCR33DRAFT_844990 [Rhizoclosmatium globosum]
MDPVLVTLGDVSLRKSDLVLLNDGEWLNDAVIQFALERLELDGAVDRRRTALVGPAVVHLLRHIDDEDFARSVANPLKLESKETVFLPVNDSEG